MALVLDNGAHSIKAGFSNRSCTKWFNSISRGRDKRIYVGNNVDALRDVSGVYFRRPIEKGQLYSWEAEKVIWDYLFDSEILGAPLDPSETHLVLSEMPFTLGSLTVNTDQICLEEYEFKEYSRLTPQSMAYWNDMSSLFDDGVGLRDCALVVDAGYTATQVVPVVKGTPKWSAIRRLDIGGKLLTNYLKETVSFRYYSMMDEPYLLNSIKEAVCYVSTNFVTDLEKWKLSPSDYAKFYLLPDPLVPELKLGKVVEDRAEAIKLKKQGAPMLTLGNERFSVPEVLFVPRDVGLFQAGLPETITESILAAPELVQPLLWSNIVVTGGTSSLPNFAERIQKELVSLCPQDVPLRVRAAPNPIEFAWQGGCRFAHHPKRSQFTISREDYLEQGENLCIRTFGKTPYE